VIGRFLQPDTIVPEPSNPQSLNRYSYVYNNPLRYTDPTGHSPYDRLFENINVCLLGIGCPTAYPNILEHQLYLPRAGDEDFGCHELGTCSPYLPQGTGIGVFASAFYEFTPIADVLSLACGHTTCGLPGGRRVSTGERLLALLGINPVGKGAKLAKFAKFADEAGAVGRTVAPKIARQMTARGWTPEMIEEAISSGRQIRAVNKANGNPATRYVHPTTGQSVVVDDVTNDVIHVGAPGYKYGPESGDLP